MTGAADGDQFTITYSRSGQVLFTATSGPITASAAVITGGLGLIPVTPVVVDFDTVTGISDFGSNLTAANVALPDVWFPWSVSLTVATSTGSVDSFIVLYEED